MSVSFRHLEIDVLGLDILVGDVLRDDLVGDVSARRYEIPSRPKMSAQNVRFSDRKSRISLIELLPLIAFMTRLGESVGGTLSKRCTWSGRMCPCAISMSNVLQISRTSSRSRRPISPRRTGLRYFGMNTKWYWHA